MTFELKTDEPFFRRESQMLWVYVSFYFGTDDLNKDIFVASQSVSNHQRSNFEDCPWREITVGRELTEQI